MSLSNSRYALALAFVTLAMLTTEVALAADKGVQATFDQPMTAVHKAAVDALAVIGCTIKKEDPAYIEGKRERKFGVFVGSGGETVSVTLSEAAPGKVGVDIRTARTFVGAAGQKNWDKPVLDEITKQLSTPAPAN
ncbi:MAG: hypothetical protein WA803_07840 [Steroidobacteraceae bacterium]